MGAIGDWVRDAIDYGEDFLGAATGRDSKNATAAAQEWARTSGRQQYGDLANDMWDRAEGGRDAAQGRLDQGRRYLQGYGQYSQNQATGGPMGQTFNQHRRELGNAGANSAGAYNNAQYNLQNGPDADNAQKAWDQYQQWMSNQSEQQQWAPQGYDYLNQPQNTQQMYGQIGQMMAGPTASQQGANQAMAMLGQGQMQSQAVMDAARSGDGALATNDARILNTMQGARQGGDFFANTQGQYMGPGMGEQRMMQALSGYDPMLERQRQKSNDAINQEMIARGGYASGGAMQALAENNAALDAEAYRTLNEQAMSGQRLGMERLGQGQSAASAAGEETLARGQGLQGLSAMQRDMELRERQMLLDQQMAAAGLMGQLAGQAGSERQGLLDTQAEVGGAADQGNVDRALGGSDIARGVDETEQAKQNTGIDAARSADDSRLSEADWEIRREQTLGDLAGQVDENQLAGLSQLLDSAYKYQGQNDAREKFLAETGIDLAGKEADLYSIFTAMGLSGYGDAVNAGINAEANSYGLGISGAQDQQSNAVGLAGILAGLL